MLSSPTPESRHLLWGLDVGPATSRSASDFSIAATRLAALSVRLPIGSPACAPSAVKGFLTTLL
jgi:hypothetical protein